MRPINVVLAHHDAVSAERLAASLGKQFRHLLLSKTAADVRSSIARFRAPFAIVDLELISIDELKQLCHQFPATAFVCIHRLADDKMWTEALAAGAVDCCSSSDLHGILEASDRYVVISRGRAAAA